MWKRKTEWLPWYRARNYKGNLTEAEKRQLDAFRTQPKHPAATFNNFPEEVQSYLSNIELELYDKKQDEAAGRALLYSAIGGGLLFLNYKSCFAAPDFWVNSIAVLSWSVRGQFTGSNGARTLRSICPRMLLGGQPKKAYGSNGS